MNDSHENLPALPLARRKRSRLGSAVQTLQTHKLFKHVSRRITSVPKVTATYGKKRNADQASENEDENHEDAIDWYMMYKVSHNWQTGNFSSQKLSTAKSTTSNTLQSVDKPSSLSQDGVSGPDIPNTIIVMSGDLIFTASRVSYQQEMSSCVSVFSTAHLHRNAGQDSKLHPEALAEAQFSCKKSSITCLAIDRAPLRKANIVRLAVTHVDGSISLLKYCKTTKQFAREFTCNDALEHVALAAFCFPLLATSTLDFKIRVYRVNFQTSRLHLLEEHHSFSCHWPACLHLEPLDSEKGEGTFDDHPSMIRLDIAFATPVYPHGWTVAIQEMIFSGSSSISSRSAVARRSHVVTNFDTSAASKAIKRSVGADRMGSRDAVKANRLTSMSYEDPFIVVGTRDNEVVCFQVDGTFCTSKAVEKSLSKSYNTLNIDFIRTLYGHTGTVHSVSLNEGRCVTGGSDGSIRVWRLGDEEISVARATGLFSALDGRLRSSLGKAITLQASNSRLPRKRKRSLEVEENAGFVPQTLADILHDSKLNRPFAHTSSTGAIRWVASAFDRIISVSSTPSNNIMSSSCRNEVDALKDDEQIQIWSFSS